MSNIDNLVFNCGNLKFNEKVLIIVDKESANLGNKIFNRLIKKNFDCILHATSPGKIHGEEPNKELENIMLKSDIIFCLRTHSMLHTKARRRSSSNGAKFLSLPDLNKVISNKSMKFNFKKITKKANLLKKKFNNANTIKIISKKGTNIVADISKRNANSAPGWCEKKGSIASPPDAEVNIAPLEKSANGVIVVDGSVTHKNIGKIKDPITLIIKNGKIIKFLGKNSLLLNKIFGNSQKKKTLGEIGLGLNKYAKLSGSMLEDEGTFGNIHFGFGSNLTFGGVNNINFHIDFIILRPQIYLDGKIIKLT